MAEGQQGTEITEASPSVQMHLSILQGVIERMATNSTSAKAWCITIVSAILVIVADKGKPDFAYLAVAPTLLFLALDTYYLAMEKGFRNAYNSFVKKVHSKTLHAEDLYAVKPVGNPTGLQIDALSSFSIWGFYLGLLGMIYAAKNYVLT